MKNILKKLHDIMGEVDFIAKDKENKFHGYNYASEQAIKQTLHPLLLKNKVLFTISASNIRHTGTITDIDFLYRFIDIENGESFEGTFVGTGEDKLDKGTYKAITGAIKYILTSTFLIPTGDDSENEVKPPNPPKTNYAGTQYENRKQSVPKVKMEFGKGDTLKTGNKKNGKGKWYAIDKADGTREWLTLEKYEYLVNCSEGNNYEPMTGEFTDDDVPFPDSQF